MKKQYTAIIGMEVHVELETNSKMFCSCANNPENKEANTHICPICLGHPGTLPRPNNAAIATTVQVGKALGCHIRHISKFDRKHYFYPDLPKGYQISQYDEPIAEFGSITLDLTMEDNPRDTAVISIRRAHLEEDTARLMHNTDGSTLVDFNRSGVPLLEIVTGPDFQTGVEAKAYCQELQLLMRYLGASAAEMEKGHMRCEANISVQEAGMFDIVDGDVIPKNGYTLNNKVELKNLNSYKAVEKGIAFEIARQTALLDDGQTWQQQTRGWNEQTQETVMQRVKENAADYRYFPEPDIPPFHPETIAGPVRIPELPMARRRRFHEEYGFSYADAALLTTNQSLANYCEATMSELIDWLHSLPEVKGDSDDIREQKKAKIARLAGGWITSKLLGQLNDRQLTITDVQISPENFAELISLIYTEKVNSTNGQKLLSDMLDAGTDIDPSHIMEEKGYGQVRDAAALEAIVIRVIQNFPSQVEEFKQGKEPIIKFLVGMCMKESEGTADPIMVEQLLRDTLLS